MAFSGGLALWRYGVMSFEEELSSWCHGVMALYSLTNRLFCPVKSILFLRRGAEPLGKLEMTSTGVLAWSMVFKHDAPEELNVAKVPARSQREGRRLGVTLQVLARSRARLTELHRRLPLALFHQVVMQVWYREPRTTVLHSTKRTSTERSCPSSPARLTWPSISRRASSPAVY
jgi:hypothetical protein